MKPAQICWFYFLESRNWMNWIVILIKLVLLIYKYWRLGRWIKERDSIDVIKLPETSILDIWDRFRTFRSLRTLGHFWFPNWMKRLLMKSDFIYFSFMRELSFYLFILLHSIFSSDITNGYLLLKLLLFLLETPLLPFIFLETY